MHPDWLRDLRDQVRAAGGATSIPVAKEPIGFAQDSALEQR